MVESLRLLVAFLPLAIILILMVGLRWSAARAGGAGYLVALLGALTVFGAGPLLLAYAHTKALLLALDVLLIIWAAFLLFRVAEEAGAIDVIVQALPHLTSDRSMQALVIGWAFASFLQGVGGFGVPVAVIAPILVGLGFPPFEAVIIPSIGHSWAVTFGSLGSSFQALMAASGLPGEMLAPTAALFLGAAGLTAGIMVGFAAGGLGGLRRLAPAVLTLGLVMSGAQYLIATAGLWNLAAIGGGLAGLLLSYPLSRRYSGNEAAVQALKPRELVLALSSYAILVVLILLFQLVEPLRDAFSRPEIALAFPELITEQGFRSPAEFGRRIPLLRHAGAILVYASAISYLIYRRAGLYSGGSLRRILLGTLQRVIPSSVGVLSMVLMSVVMAHAGMTDLLARGLAENVGTAFPAAAPWIGALGAFMTGSNTNSNVVFTTLQLRTADLLGHSAAVILAAQTAGGALGSVIAPTKIIVGASTAGLLGREGETLRRMAPYAVILVALISLLTVAALAIGK